MLLAFATLSGNGNYDPGDNDEVIEGHDDDIDVVNDDCDDVEWTQSCFSSFPFLSPLAFTTFSGDGGLDDYVDNDCGWWWRWKRWMMMMVKWHRVSKCHSFYTRQNL